MTGKKYFVLEKYDGRKNLIELESFLFVRTNTKGARKVRA